VAAEQGRQHAAANAASSAAELQTRCSSADVAPSKLLLANTLRQAPLSYPGTRHASTTAPLARVRDYIPAAVMCSRPPEQSEVTQPERRGAKLHVAQAVSSSYKTVGRTGRFVPTYLGSAGTSMSWLQPDARDQPRLPTSCQGPSWPA